MIGEIGGSAEEEAAEFLVKAGRRRKPMVGFIAGAPRLRDAAWAMPVPLFRAARAAPKSKIEAMQDAGIVVSHSPAALGTTLAGIFS